MTGPIHAKKGAAKKKNPVPSDEISAEEDIIMKLDGECEQREAVKAANEGVYKDTSKAGLLSVDRFGFTRVRYFGILSFAGLVEKPSCQNAIYCFVHQSDRNERSRDISTSYMHLFRVVPQSKYKQFFYNYASDLVGTGRLGLGLGLWAGVGVGVGHIINSRQQFA